MAQTCAVNATTAQLTLAVRATQATVLCPLGTTPAHCIHSHYERTLADLVRLQLRVRKGLCPQPHCRWRMFTDRLPTITAPWI